MMYKMLLLLTPVALVWALIVGITVSTSGGSDTAGGNAVVVKRNLTIAELRMIERSDIAGLVAGVKRDPTILNATSYREGACTGIAYAAKLGHANVVNFFALYRVDLEARCHNDQFTPLMLACLCSQQQEFAHNLCPRHLKHEGDKQDAHAEVIRVLLTKGAAIDNAEPQHGRTALHFAALNGDKDALEQLLLVGGNGNAMDKSGWTPLLYAVQRGNLAIVTLLVHAGADINHADGMGSTALSHAAHFGNSKLVQKLLELGADCTVLDNSHRTPLYYAQANGHSEIIKLLEKAMNSVAFKTEL